MKRSQANQIRLLKYGFWTVAALYALCPFILAVSGHDFLRYRAAENELFRPGVHDALQTEYRCRLDDCDEIPVVWRDRQTGTVFREEQFREHRRAEARRIAGTWFGYGALGCLLAAWYRQQFFGESFIARLGQFLLAVAALVGAVVVNLPT
jgi:hypothetical protein